MRKSTYCDRCRVEIESQAVEFLRITGLLAWILSHPIRGYFCRRCTGILFCKAAATNLTLGLLWWLGPFAGPLLTFANIFPLLSSLRLPRKRGDERTPELDDQVMQRVWELLPMLSDDMERETGDLHESAAKFAPTKGLRAAQVIHAVRLLVEQSAPGEPEGRRGFEVILRNLRPPSEADCSITTRIHDHES
ncbi:MAG TPA: hypothetical protein VK797_04255 [Tepidisphaeraceae bacterium]|jgi:hypothetical protein|nr:hypothetical protein [Tepidisphaeraceae bacterium]